MNPLPRGLLAMLGFVAARLAADAPPMERPEFATFQGASERPTIFAEKPFHSTATDAAAVTGNTRRSGGVSETLQRRITEGVLRDLSVANSQVESRVGPTETEESLVRADGLVILERYVVRSTPLPDLSSPKIKNRFFEALRTGNLYQHRGETRTTDLNLFGSPVENRSIGNTGAPRLTLGFSISW